MAGAGSLALRGITRRFGDTVAVDGVCLEIAEGELLAIVGASGSGKTTTLRIAGGYEPADAGSVLLDGEDITLRPPQHRNFGMVFQQYALFPHLSVENNVAFGLEARGVARPERLSRARAVLATVGLAGAGPRTVQSLSGGEQQRVAIARALVIEPRVLLLDEPLSNLDPTLRETMREELRALFRHQRLTALFVTHDQADAFAIADRVAVMRLGCVLQVGTPDALYATPACRAVAAFVGRATLVPAQAEGGLAAVTIGGIARRVRVATPDGAPLTGAVFAVLRPEALSLSPADAGEPDTWPGIVRSLRFAGAAYAYHVGLADGTDVEVAAPERVAAEGDRVRVGIIREPVAVVGD
jgi:ABC-type Fe3+/spermidine/putrescine transport system ATPase subunit